MVYLPYVINQHVKEILNRDAFTLLQILFNDFCEWPTST